GRRRQTTIYRRRRSTDVGGRLDCRRSSSTRGSPAPPSSRFATHGQRVSTAPGQRCSAGPRCDLARRTSAETQSPSGWIATTRRETTNRASEAILMTDEQKSERNRNDGLRKRCECSRRSWSKCEHPWHFNFKLAGEVYRFSLDRKVGRIVKD